LPLHCYGLLLGTCCCAITASGVCWNTGMPTPATHRLVLPCRYRRFYTSIDHRYCCLPATCLLGQDASWSAWDTCSTPAVLPASTCHGVLPWMIAVSPAVLLPALPCWVGTWVLLSLSSLLGFLHLPLLLTYFLPHLLLPATSYEHHCLFWVPDYWVSLPQCLGLPLPLGPVLLE